jgi:hypothetical protein
VIQTKFCLFNLIICIRRLIFLKEKYNYNYRRFFLIFAPMIFEFVLQVQLFFSLKQDISVSINLFLK